MTIDSNLTNIKLSLKNKIVCLEHDRLLGYPSTGKITKYISSKVQQGISQQTAVKTARIKSLSAINIGTVHLERWKTSINRTK